MRTITEPRPPDEPDNRAVPELVVVTLVAAATALATGAGSLPVLALGRAVEAFAPALWGAAGGVMVVAAAVGLFLPALDVASLAVVLAGTSLGGGAFLLVRARLRARSDLHLGALRGAGARRGVLVIATMFAHSLPEGLAIGAAWAGGDAVGVFVVLAVAIQNVPEGMVSALPLVEARWGPARVFWTATATSAPQIPGAILAYGAVTVAGGGLGVAYALAAGAMLALVAYEVAPAAATAPARGIASAAAGAAGMGVLAVLIGP